MCVRVPLHGVANEKGYTKFDTESKLWNFCAHCAINFNRRLHHTATQSIARTFSKRKSTIIFCIISVLIWPYLMCIHKRALLSKGKLNSFVVSRTHIELNSTVLFQPFFCRRAHTHKMSFNLNTNFYSSYVYNSVTTKIKFVQFYRCVSLSLFRIKLLSVRNHTLNGYV